MQLELADRPKFLLARGVVNAVENLRDKSIAIENTIGTEYLFTLLANGVKERDICDELDVSEDEFRMIVTSSPTLRKRYMEAKAFRLGDLSARTLIDSGFATATSFSKYEKNAVDFHSVNIDRAMKIGDEGNLSTGVVVNNTVVVRGNNEVPPLPPELEDIIDVDPVIGTDAAEG